MLPSADSKFNYAALPTEKAASARAAAERIKLRVQNVYVETGKDLLDQKMSLGHGHFLRWLEAEFGWSERTAQRMMSVAEMYLSNPTHVSDFEQLTDRALTSLASAKEQVRTEVLERTSNGEKVTAAEIEKLKKRLAKAEEKISEKEAQRAAQESRANIAARQVSDATNRAMFAEADKERLADEVENLRIEIERLTETDVITVKPLPPVEPTVLHTSDGKRVIFISAATMFLKIWNDAPIEWRSEFAMGRLLPEDLVELLNAA